MLSKLSKLKVYYQNVRGLKMKTKIFRRNLLASSYDVIILCETWLRPDIFTSELFDDSYIVYRKDRNNAALGKGDGGGCLIAVKRHLCSSRIECFELDTDVWVSISHVGGAKTYFNVKYIELSSKYDDYNKHFAKIVENVMSSGTDDSFILAGDYNLRDSVKWSYDSRSNECVASDCEGNIANELVDTLSLCGLSQFNCVQNVNKRTLDLFISDMQPGRVKVCLSDDPLVPVDGHHPPLYVELDMSRVKYLSENRPPKVNFYRADYVWLDEELSKVNWSNELADLGIDDAVNRFYRILDGIVDLIPKVSLSTRDYPVYFSHKLITLIKKKESVRRKMNKEKRPAVRTLLEAEFSVLRKSVKAGKAECFDAYVNDCEEKIKSNNKCFFAFTKSLRKSNSLPNGMRYEDEYASDRLSVCNLFAKFFKSVYNPPVAPLFEPVCDPFTYQVLPHSEGDFMTFTPLQVEKALKSFDKNKVASPDNLPMMFFMQLALSLSLPLSILFNKSLSEMKFPTRWKISFVSPIFKEGDKSDVMNYRPVSILCAMSKIFERLVFIKVFEDVKSNIHHTQHGFFERRSTQTNLMEYVSMVADSIANGGQVDTIYTDFAKAFDKVDHGILLTKLSSFGLHTNLVKWFSTYMRDRTQFVVIGGTKSDGITPTSGVPQGSILGPLLFIIFINDLLSSLTACSGFADDLKIFRAIRSSYDCDLLQDDLVKMVEWCRKNNMTLNVEKCAVMSTTHSRNKVIFPYG